MKKILQSFFYKFYAFIKSLIQKYQLFKKENPWTYRMIKLVSKTGLRHSGLGFFLDIGLYCFSIYNNYDRIKEGVSYFIDPEMSTTKKVLIGAGAAAVGTLAVYLIKNKIDTYKSERDFYKSNFEKVSAENQIFKKKCDDFEKDIKLHRKHYNDLSIENDNLKKDFKDIEALAYCHENQLNSISEEQKLLLERKAELERYIDRKQQDASFQYENLIELNQSLVNQNDILNKKIEKYQNIIESNTSIQQYNLKEIQSLTESYDELNQAFSDLANSNNKLTADYLKEKDAMVKEYQLLSNRYKTLKMELQDLEINNRGVNANNLIISGQYEDLKKQFDILNTKVQANTNLQDEDYGSSNSKDEDYGSSNSKDEDYGSSNSKDEDHRSSN